MHLITEIVWKLVTFVVVCVFTISLPFILLVLVIWHPNMSPQAEQPSGFSSICYSVRRLRGMVLVDRRPDRHLRSDQGKSDDRQVVLSFFVFFGT